MTANDHNLDLVNIDAYIKFGSQDIERKWNSDPNQGL